MAGAYVPRSKKRSQADIVACGECKIGTVFVDPACANCRVKCTGKGGCDELLPAKNFRLQRREGPPMMKPGLWRPLCMECEYRARKKTGACVPALGVHVERRSRVIQPAVC